MDSEVSMGDHYGDKVDGDKIQQWGSNNTGKIEAGIRSASSDDLHRLTEALSKLRHQAAPAVASADDAVAYGALAEAEIAAAKGDVHATNTALRKAGTWALTQATTIGIPLAVEALKRSLGIA